jgi:hypothetical protein
MTLDLKARTMNDDIVALRLAVSLLGEKDNHNWWPSAFLTEIGSKSLQFVFGRGTALAQYTGAVAAGQKRHDEAVGRGGRVFHLFRLPEETEQSIHADLAERLASVMQQIDGPDAARSVLRRFATVSADAGVGPVLIGRPGDLEGDAWLQKAAAVYALAFERGIQSFPYVRATEP